MTDPRYDQYREALRLGHLATQRERHDAAAAAYREAARLAPDRALPLVGLGGALAKLGRTDDAIDVTDMDASWCAVWWCCLRHRGPGQLRAAYTRQIAVALT